MWCAFLSDTNWTSVHCKFKVSKTWLQASWEALEYLDHRDAGIQSQAEKASEELCRYKPLAGRQDQCVTHKEWEAEESVSWEAGQQPHRLLPHLCSRLLTRNRKGTNLPWTPVYTEYKATGPAEQRCHRRLWLTSPQEENKDVHVYFAIPFLPACY